MKYINITVKPSSYRDMVKDALLKAGWTFTGSGYDLEDDIGDLDGVPPSGASPKEFGPMPIPVNPPFNPQQIPDKPVPGGSQTPNKPPG